MTRLLVAAFLIAHGLIHPAIYATPYKPDEAPFDPGHSWVMTGVGVAARPARLTAALLSAVTAAVLCLAGLAVLLDVGWWAGAAGFGAALGIALKITYFDRWLILGLLLDGAVLWAVITGWPPALT